ncbi:alkylhydroperoxidase AhpD family core domain-containing protein [Loktanella salsilacus]|uniref:Alkylhydroperoxidase AhpD family core domain-containing protein n=2 Tax=Loktanella salsilacus TaxID=195913 RepID=A0A1I4EAC0_9RHOB|nr:carboxymuconolactone decarboxylase family protein [Loktanella salsilacus]SFL02764.1 alkylhydroperoxidase AhpD family core domain-containing protein [Loktanella salsilacus]
MCIAIGIAKQCDDCIGFHVKAAIAAGVTREEIAETISVAMYMGGGPSFMYGARALEAFDQMSV